MSPPFRLTLAVRLTLIVVTFVMTGWLAGLSVYYLNRGPTGPAMLAPERLAAIVALLEDAGEGRDTVVAALASPTLGVAIEPGSAAGQPVAEGPLAGRAVSVRPMADHAGPLPRLTRGSSGFVYRIGLGSGETLVLTTSGGTLLNGFGLPVGIGAGLIGTFIAVAALLVMHFEMRPLKQLAAAADALDLSGRSAALPEPRSSAPEIRSLVHAFNRLQARLATLVAARLVMVGGISHDVRTFATRLKLRLATLPPSQTRERAIADVADIVTMLDDALLATRVGAGELAEELLELAPLVEAEVADRRATGASVTLRTAPEAIDAAVLGDRLALRRIVSNLIDNALKYGKAAHVFLRRIDDGEPVLEFVVEDEGDGIPADQREMLLEPFVRLESSRSRATGGAGLGLAIVKSLVEGHGGALLIGDAPGGGARICVRLPVFAYG